MFLIWGSVTKLSVGCMFALVSSCAPSAQENKTLSDMSRTFQVHMVAAVVTGTLQSNFYMRLSNQSELLMYPWFWARQPSVPAVAT